MTQLTTPDSHSDWPDIPLTAWRETHEALHLFVQIVGKYRFAHTPWVNHSWHATLYVTPRGLSTSAIPDPSGSIEISFDFLDHQVRAVSTRGVSDSFALQAMTVSEFHARFVALVEAVGGEPGFHGRPNEVADPVPFAEDNRPRPYDAEAVQRFHRALLSSSRVLEQFRTGFLGKSSPVHVFWGSFDLAVTRFSGRPAPLHPGGIPALPDTVTQEAYSHEVSSAGFWAGGGPIDEPAFYSYAYPAPDGFSDAVVTPESAYFDSGAGEFILPYASVRAADDPASTLLGFLESTYVAAASLADWDRLSLECEPGRARRPRPLK